MRLKKSLGQHILVAAPTAEKIVRTLSPSKDDVVLEIGPGRGALTKHISKIAGRVIAIEKDLEMIERLESLNLENLEIIHADFLKCDLNSVLTRVLAYERARVLFCGNLPYNISTPILFKLKENAKLFSRGIIMIQREVAERLVAKPGTKDYGVLSIMIQVAARMKKCFNVSAKSFFPPPKVTSAVVEMDFSDPPPYKVDDPSAFAYVVKSTFKTRRKMIRNSIPKEYLPALEKAGIAPTRRPETLSIDEFIAIVAGDASGLRA